MHRQPKSGVFVVDNVDTAVKDGLILRLKECMSEIVMKYTSDNWVTLKNEEATNNLCWILEAVFIHGLKNTFIKSLFSSRKESSIPNPSFWEFVMIFSHRDLINQVRKLNYVNTDVGRSRAWIRITLNEMSLVSYLENILRNPQYVRSFYKPSAFLRDSEKSDVLKNYLIGLVESCKFDLVVDNSLLNQWTSGPLCLVGLWMDDNVVEGVDVAENMESKDLQAVPKLSKSKTPEPEFMKELRRQPLLAEDDALRIIMTSKPSSSNSGSAASSRRNSFSSQVHPNTIVKGNPVPSSSEFLKIPVQSKTATTIPATEAGTKSLSSSPSPNCNTHVVAPNVKQQQQVEVSVILSHSKRSVYEKSNESVKEEETSVEQEEVPLSYIEILNAYTSDKKVGSDIFSNLAIETKEETAKTTSTDNDSGSGVLGPSDEVHLPSPQVQVEDTTLDLLKTFSSTGDCKEMYPRLSKYASKLANEVGMDVQQYCCRFCRAPIGMGLAIARVCHFTGHYFCTNCHTEDMSIIPARILLNWDFTPFAVCKSSFEFLDTIKQEPLFDLEQINPKLYSYIDELAELRDLRKKLNYVSIYLKTCKDESVFKAFKEEFGASSHLFEKIHLYSMTDLQSVTNRSIFTLVLNTLKKGKDHIIACTICKSKGFICEICRNPEVIFPFEFSQIFKCHSCGAVYHNRCMNNSKPCPRCQRWRNSPIGNISTGNCDSDLDCMG